MLKSALVPLYVEGLTSYVLSRRGSDGGYLSFQYMDMFESTAEDTFYAVSVLSTLGVELPYAERTINFLKRLQNTEGGYRSVEVAYYSITALKVLGAEPRDPEGAARFLLRALEATLSDQGDNTQVVLDERPLVDESGVLRSKDSVYSITPADVTPWLNRVSMITLALKALGELSSSIGEAVFNAILKLHSTGGGFGSPEPQLESTYWAVEGLTATGRNPPPGTAQWVLSCENEDGGFSVTPYSRSYFVENLYFGLQALHKLGSGPKHADSHARYLFGLQNANGGFRRSPSHGVSSLEYTYYAVQSMKLLRLF